MSHQCYTATLRSTVEESDLCAILFQAFCVEHRCRIGVGMHTLAIAGLICDDSCSVAIHANFVTVNDLQSRLVGLSKRPALISIDAQRELCQTDPNAFRTTASACSSTDRCLGSFFVPTLCLPELGSSTRGTTSNSSHRRVGS